MSFRSKVRRWFLKVMVFECDGFEIERVLSYESRSISIMVLIGFTMTFLAKSYGLWICIFLELDFSIKNQSIRMPFVNMYLLV